MYSYIHPKVIHITERLNQSTNKDQAFRNTLAEPESQRKKSWIHDFDLISPQGSKMSHSFCRSNGIKVRKFEINIATPTPPCQECLGGRGLLTSLSWNWTLPNRTKSSFGRWRPNQNEKNRSSSFGPWLLEHKVQPHAKQSINFTYCLMYPLWPTINIVGHAPCISPPIDLPRWNPWLTQQVPI